MSVINADEYNYFKSAASIFSKVRRDLSSFDAAGIIDEGEFPTYVKEVLRFVGLSVYKEGDAVSAVKNYKAKLPTDFSQLHAAYKCTPYIDAKDFAKSTQQGAPISVYNDVTWELLQVGNNADITVVNSSSDTKILERITVRQNVKETPVDVSFKNLTLLQLSPNVKRDRVSEDCANSFVSSPYEITIDNGYIYTNFSNDSIYLKYYALPLDDDGIPMILDNERLEKAIEWYIKYQLLLSWWYNNNVPDLQNRWQHAEAQYNKWLGEIIYERKMPSFNQMINSIRRQRAVHKIAIFANG